MIRALRTLAVTLTLLSDAPRSSATGSPPPALWTHQLHPAPGPAPLLFPPLQTSSLPPSPDSMLAVIQPSAQPSPLSSGVPVYSLFVPHSMTIVISGRRICKSLMTPRQQEQRKKTTCNESPTHRALVTLLPSVHDKVNYLLINEQIRFENINQK